ncbi:hypothetical protein [Paraburkholderia sp. BL17N1]|uniref:hypothetical protein n=1 Tax=Paraburkholderia sp. BL17N1 TaxID=1938798 RepID=UPI0011C415B6|nr:hypothetical protein [Paraburkholderia sp. BL17N1]
MRKQHLAIPRKTSMPVSKKRRKLANASAEQATKKRLLTSPLARAEADRIVLHIRVGLEAIRSGHNDETALLNLQSVVLLTEMLTAEGRGALPLDMIRETGRQVVHLLEGGQDREQWTVPAALSDALIAIVNEYDRIMHQVPLQAVLAATGKLERLEKDDPRYFRCMRDDESAVR